MHFPGETFSACDWNWVINVVFSRQPLRSHRLRAGGCCGSRWGSCSSTTAVGADAASPCVFWLAGVAAGVDRSPLTESCRPAPGRGGSAAGVDPNGTQVGPLLWQAVHGPGVVDAGQCGVTHLVWPLVGRTLKLGCFIFPFGILNDKLPYPLAAHPSTTTHHRPLSHCQRFLDLGCRGHHEVVLWQPKSLPTIFGQSPKNTQNCLLSHEFGRRSGAQMYVPAMVSHMFICRIKNDLSRLSTHQISCSLACISI